MKKFQYLIIIIVPVLVCYWAYLNFNGQILRPAQYALGATAVLLGLFRLRLLKNEKKNSGLSEEEYLLKQAGGAGALLSQSITTRVLGWLCVIAPVILVVVTLLGTRSLKATAFVALLLGVICIPCAIGCFRVATRSRRIAEHAGAKIW